MSILSDILSKIFSHPLTTQPGATGATGDTGAAPPSTVGSVAAAAGQAAAGAAGGDMQQFLSKLGENNPDLDWQHSIVDLLKLIGHDSSRAAREALADELHYTGDKTDSAAMNEFLLGAVMKELTSGGGKLPSGQ